MKKQSRKQSFLKQFSASQRRIYAFILTYVPDYADAADVMQETAMLLWKKYNTFKQDSDFTAWAIAIARNKILKLQTKRFDNRIRFDSTIVSLFAETMLSQNDEIDRRRKALQDCMKKLSRRDAELIHLRYEEKMSTVDIAKIKTRPLQGLYKTMARIHQNLRECVNKSLNRKNNHE